MKDKKNKMKVGYVAIVGLPNVGKSTLMNSLLHQKLTIVSPKPQTTRHRILGILNGEGHQVIFLDTPGLIEPRYHLQDAMMKAAQRTMQESDLILVMVDASNAKTHELEGVKQLEVLTAPKLLLINKIDKVPRSSILPIIDRFDKMHVFHDILPVSALKAEGLDTLISIILDVLPEGDPFYSPDAVSDEPERFFVSELIREKIYFNYGEEIPYSTAVIIDEFQERPGRKDYIRAIVMVERDSQKGILIGKGGKALKKVGRQSRESIEAFLDRPVFLDLHIQVRKKWRKDKSQVKRLGYS